MTHPSVAILHFTCPPVVGGVELLIATHAGLLADHGYPTRVIAGKGESFRADVPVHLIPALYSKNPELLAINEELDRGVVTHRFLSATDHLYHDLQEALDGVQVCVVHNAFTLHFNLPLTAALWRMAEKGEGRRFVAWCHDLSWKNDLYVPKMRELFPWRLLKQPLEPVTYVVVSATRQVELSDLFGVPPDRLRVVPAGVDPMAQLKLEPETIGLVRGLGLLEDDLLMLAPVRITKRKNLELSIRITHALLQQGVRARLVVTGPPGPHNVRSGDYVDELRQLRTELGVEREVVFLFEEADLPPPTPLPDAGRREQPSVSPFPRGEGGRGVGSYWVTDRIMWDLYSLSDLLLFSSAQEGFGIPLLEAGLFKLPVFCSHIPPFREIGLDTVSYFELDDPPAMTAGRIRAWMERDAVYRLRKRVLASYSWESIFRREIEPLLSQSLLSP